MRTFVFGLHTTAAQCSVRHVCAPPSPLRFLPLSPPPQTFPLRRRVEDTYDSFVYPFPPSSPSLPLHVLPCYATNKYAHHTHTHTHGLFDSHCFFSPPFYHWKKEHTPLSPGNKHANKQNKQLQTKKKITTIQRILPPKTLTSPRSTPPKATGTIENDEPKMHIKSFLVD